MPKIRRGETQELTPFTPGTPVHLLGLWQEGLCPAWVAVDTETSGLFRDGDGKEDPDGIDVPARVSTVSVAWPDFEGEWGPGRFDGLKWQIEEIAPGYEVPIVSVAWPFDQGAYGKGVQHGAEFLWPDAENLDLSEWQALLSWLVLVGEDGGISMHNAPFDCEKIEVGVASFNDQVGGLLGVDLTELVDWDTQNVNNALWGWERTSLKPTCQRLWPQRWDGGNETAVKDYLRKHYPKRPGRYDLIPWSILGPYADDDARMTAMLKLRQIWERREWRAAKWLPDHMIERRLKTTKVLRRMTQRALPYHATASYAAAEEATQRLNEIGKELPFNPAKVEDAKRYYFGTKLESTGRGARSLGLEPYAVTDKGGVSLTAEVLDRMVNDGHPWAAEYAAWRRADTARSMWYLGYAAKTNEEEHRVRTYFRQNGTNSSRFSVERVNLQAIPADYRFSGVEILAGIPTPRQLIAQAVEEFWPGWKLYELDLAQAELRIASLYASAGGRVRSKMLEMIQTGADMHAFTTMELFKVDQEDRRWGEFRQVGKRGNFSLCFGSGGATFQRMLAEQAGIRWDYDRCSDVVWAWRKLYPEFVGADGRGGAVFRHSRVVERRQRQHPDGIGYLSWKNGERRWFQPYEEAHKAFNQRVQGDQAQFNIDWLLETDELLVGAGFDGPRAPGAGTAGGRAGLILPIHDSQVLLLPDTEEGKGLAEACADRGRKLWSEWFPGVPGDIEVKTW